MFCTCMSDPPPFSPFQSIANWKYSPIFHGTGASPALGPASALSESADAAAGALAAVVAAAAAAPDCDSSAIAALGTSERTGRKTSAAPAAMAIPSHENRRFISIRTRRREPWVPGEASPPGMAEPTIAARRRGERGHHFDRSPDDGSDHELRDPIAALDAVGTAAQVHEQHLDLAPVVGVDRTGSVRNADRVLRGEPASGAHLALVSDGDLESQPGRNGDHLARGDLDRAVDGRDEIHSRGVLRLVLRRADRVLLERDLERDRGHAAPRALLSRRSAVTNGRSPRPPSATRLSRSRWRSSPARRRTSSSVTRSIDSMSSRTGTFRPA